MLDSGAAVLALGRSVALAAGRKESVGGVHSPGQRERGVGRSAANPTRAESHQVLRMGATSCGPGCADKGNPAAPTPIMASDPLSQFVRDALARSQALGQRAAEWQARTQRQPGQYYERGFPVLSAGPTPRTPLEEWTFSIRGAVDETRSWTREEFTALPAEDVTVDIHCVTKRTKLDTRWKGVSVDTLLEGVETEPTM